LTLYLDSSALLKRYVAEPESAACNEILASDEDWITARLTLVEVTRNLPRQIKGVAALRAKQAAFTDDLARTHIVELDVETCRAAAVIAERTGTRTLDALHLAAAQRVASPSLVVVTYDHRLAAGARSLGLTVAGV
jgi:uncharacterized protein